MPRMRAIDAAVHVLEREGVTTAFGVPGAAINPLYSALKARGSITHILARHVEGASHMAEGYTRAAAGNIGKDANGQGWTILSFKASAPRRQGVVPIHTFIEYLVDKGELRADEYVASVEFGNELSGGAGTTWVKQLEVKVAP